ncbi:MAG: three-Cys-motif partner protein TcmP [Candidatus Aminicenantes bacterium]|nr:three-Cys-motif partner protein TcmP [Candidatus Aminicenantes bacterium]
MVASNDFFEKKKNWSLLKDQIIENYLKPYIAKILFTRKPLVIVDCFAGKGKFDDEKFGSPLIIAEHIKTVLESDAYLNKMIKAIFIEKKYFRELEENLKGYKGCYSLEGSFEHHIQSISRISKNSNLFLYVDPYGIKSLDFSNFKALAERSFHTTELLMNFNSFGFLREGARLLKYESLLEEFDDFDYELDDKNSIENMNRIAAGDYWQEILTKKSNGEISMFKAEEYFMKEYSKKIQKIYNYSVNIPIRKKTEQLPKYRLIFGTNHKDGLFLMVEQMNKAWKEILDNARGGMKILFEEFLFPDMTVMSHFDVEADILNSLSVEREILYEDLLVKLIEKYGISYYEKEYREKIKGFEKKNKLVVRRNPPHTPKGKPSRSWDFKKFKIYLRSK